MIQKRIAKNGKTVYRVHRKGYQGYFWYEDFDSAFWMAYKLLNN